jgi:hypothetical protein
MLARGLAASFDLDGRVRSTMIWSMEGTISRLAPRVLAVTLLLAFMAAGGPARAQNWIENDIVVLQGLDKITARISTFEASLDRVARFGTLEIIPRSCQKRPPEEQPESAAFLEIEDTYEDRESERLFSGWMFASSPALSALEHPIYDVWVIDCRRSLDIPE